MAEHALVLAEYVTELLNLVDSVSPGAGRVRWSNADQYARLEELDAEISALAQALRITIPFVDTPNSTWPLRFTQLPTLSRREELQLQ